MTNSGKILRKSYKVLKIGPQLHYCPHKITAAY